MSAPVPFKFTQKNDGHREPDSWLTIKPEAERLDAAVIQELDKIGLQSVDDLDENNPDHCWAALAYQDLKKLRESVEIKDRWVPDGWEGANPQIDFESVENFVSWLEIQIVVVGQFAECEAAGGILCIGHNSIGFSLRNAWRLFKEMYKQHSAAENTNGFAEKYLDVMDQSIHDNWSRQKITFAYELDRLRKLLGWVKFQLARKS